MANPGWMFHPTGGKQLYPDLTPAFQRQLESEGWVDSPDKLEKKGLAHTNAGTQGDAGPQTNTAPKPEPTLAEIVGRFSADDLKAVGLVRVMSPGDLVDLGPEAFRAGHDIASSAQALARIGTIIDADGDRADQSVPDVALIAVIDAMSRDEVSLIIMHLGGDLAVDQQGMTYPLRVQLIKMLRPGGEYAGYPGWSSDVSTSEVGEGTVEPQNDPSLETATEDELTGGTEVRLVGEITTDQFGAASPANRQQWLEADGTTKKHIAALLDAKGVVYKDRDPKATLGQQLLDAFAPQPE